MQYFLQLKLGIKNQWLLIIFSGIFSPLTIVFLDWQIKTIPKAYIEMAEIDGASKKDVFIKLIIPLIRPSIITSAFILFSDSYNMIDQAMIFIKDEINLPLSVFLSNLKIDNPGAFFPLSVFYMIVPMFVFYYSNQFLSKSLNNNILLN